jgi:prefoldin subunit 5
VSTGGASGDERGVSQLESAMATERGLREQINDLVNARHRAQAEARRLGERAGVPGTDPSLSEVGERYRTQAARLGEEIESLRRSLREQEATTEALRADEAGV